MRRWTILIILLLLLVSSGCIEQVGLDVQPATKAPAITIAPTTTAPSITLPTTTVEPIVSKRNPLDDISARFLGISIAPKDGLSWNELPGVKAEGIPAIVNKGDKSLTNLVVQTKISAKKSSEVQTEECTNTIELLESGKKEMFRCNILFEDAYSETPFKYELTVSYGDEKKEVVTEYWPPDTEKF